MAAQGRSVGTVSMATNDWWPRLEFEYVNYLHYLFSTNQLLPSALKENLFKKKSYQGPFHGPISLPKVTKKGNQGPAGWLPARASDIRLNHLNHDR